MLGTNLGRHAGDALGHFKDCGAQAVLKVCERVLQGIGDDVRIRQLLRASQYGEIEYVRVATYRDVQRGTNVERTN